MRLEPPASESFSALVLRHRGRARLTQRQLAASCGVALRTVQDWEAGNSYPSADRLRALITALLEANGLSSGHEAQQAQALWDAAATASPRLRTSFDGAWFSRLLGATSELVPAQSSTAERRQDWGEAPDSAGFVGRADELAMLRGWVLDERCRLIALLGMGGVGKTSLASRLAHEVAPSFERVYWRSLRDAPPVGEWLEGAIGFLSDQDVVPPVADSERLTTLLQLLRARRCLVVLDNCETLLEPGQEQPAYRRGMAGYGRLVEVVAAANHQSCVLLTTRETLPELSTLSGGATRNHRLGGIGADDARALLGQRDLVGSDQHWADLNDRFGGNALALKLVTDSIRELFGGDIGAFLEQARTINIFGGIRRLVGEQVERSSIPEQHVLRVLAVEREPVALKRLIAELGPTTDFEAGLEAVEALRRRSLIERIEAPWPAFTLQSVVLEYVTDQLVAVVADEIWHGRPDHIVEQTLVHAQAKDYIRQAQERVIGGPIVQRLAEQYGAVETELKLMALVDAWRDRPAAEQGYGPGNVIDLLRLLRRDLRNLNLARLTIRRANLADAEAQDASLAGSRLVDTVLAEGFDFPGSVALSADGAILAAGTSTGQVWLWRVADRTPLVAVHGSAGAVWGVALSADGSLLASGSADGALHVWETSTGRAMAALRGHTGVVRSVALSADGHLLASGGTDGAVRLWETATGRPLGALEGTRAGVWRLALSAAGDLLASVGTDGLVQVWDTDSKQVMRTMREQAGAIRSISLAADGRLLATGGTDGLVQLWDTSTAQPLTTLQSRTGEIWGLALSGDGHVLASGGTDGLVQLWDTKTSRPAAALQGLRSGVWGLTMSADGLLLGSGCTDGTVRLWEATSGRPMATLHGHIGAIRGLAMDRRGHLVASVGTDGLVRLWDVETGRPAANLEGHTGEVWGVAMSADAHLLASVGTDGMVHVWDVDSARLLVSLRGHVGGIRSIAMSPSGHLLVSGGTDGTVRLWETSSSRLLATLEGHAGEVRSVALSPRGELLASGGTDRTVRLWDATSARQLAVLEGHAGEVWSVAWAADGDRLASGGVDGTVRIWDTGTWQPAATLAGDTGGVLGVGLPADRPDLLAIGGTGGSVQIWNTSSQQPVATLTAHSGGVPGIAFSGDGQLLATGSFDGTVNLWDVSSGARIRTLRPQRRYERLDITGVTGITEGQRQALIALGAVDWSSRQ